MFIAISEFLTIKRSPGLIYDIKANGARDLVNVGMEDLVYEADGRRLERVVVREMNPNLPHATLIRGCKKQNC